MDSRELKFLQYYKDCYINYLNVEKQLGYNDSYTVKVFQELIVVQEIASIIFEIDVDKVQEKWRKNYDRS